jgi:hypothetical protein
MISAFGYYLHENLDAINITMADMNDLPNQLTQPTVLAVDMVFEG